MSFITAIYERIRRSRLHFASSGKGLRIHGFPVYVMNSNVQLGNNVQIYPNVTFFGDGDIIIGNDVKIGNNVVINATKGSFVKILDKTIIAANTYIIDCNHNIARERPIQNQGVTMSPVTIGEDVWIGASSVIGMGVTVGKGAVIGANSFVNKSVPEYAIAVGSPAKVIGERS